MLRVVLWISSVVIWIIKKLSGANITVSGTLPDAPVLFMANHFTRFETFLVPYVLFSNYRRIGRSLADDSVFVGWLGEYMKMAGTVSSKNKARDCIILDDLLSAKADWVIYPEGKMVKNKEISLEERQFFMNCATCKVEYQKEALHTGSALLALKSEIMRQEIIEHGNVEEQRRFCSEHCMSHEYLDEKVSLAIVPLSITYYPIRPGRNRFLLLLNKWFNLRGTRLFEELEIEINLLMNANMHLHFGEPIWVKEYIEAYQKEHKGSLSNTTYVDELLDVQRKVLTYDVMKKVYGNMQINFDHIFVLTLLTMPTLRVCPSYLKVLIYKNVRELRFMQGLNLHPELQSGLFKLILEKHYAPFESALELAVKQKILFRDSEGEYLFDKPLLEKAYPFHKVRVRNTLKVILNEIRWQEKIVESAKYNAQYSEKELRQQNFQHLKKREWRYFEQEYLRYHNEKPTKDKIGSPKILFSCKNRVGLVFSHGYMASPAEAERLAHYLFERGINVYLPRLRGHGTDPQALKEVLATDWEQDFARACTAMRQVCDKVFVGGFSTGGLLALIHAGRYEVDGVIVINSALRLHNLKVAYVVPTLNAFNEMIAHLHAKGIKEWIENPSENLEINYAKHPLSSVAEMEKVMSLANRSLSSIKDPILILQGDNDPVVNPESARTIYEQVGSAVKKLELIPREQHIIVNSEGDEEVFESIYRFVG